MSSNESELSVERLALIAQELPPEEVADLIVANLDYLPPTNAILKIINSLPQEQGMRIFERIVAHFPLDVLKDFVANLADRLETGGPSELCLDRLEKFVANLADRLERERQEGIALGVELVNQVLRKELSREEFVERLVSLPPTQFTGAQNAISLISGVNNALNRITTGEARLELVLPPDEDGYYDRMCPSNDCRGKFKIYYKDWVDKDFASVKCPFCGHHSRHDDFDTPTQREHVRYRGMRLLEGEVGKDLPSVAFSIHPMDYEKPRDVVVAIERTMRQRFLCERCACRYSSVGAAFFCPACGHNSAISTFDAAVETVRKTMDSISTIRQAVAAAVDEDAAEDSIRQICENDLIKLVSSFQRFAEAWFDLLPNRSLFNPRRNLFQNLADSADLWRSAIGEDYGDMLTPSELSDLERFFQQRHLLAHKEGMVDQMYIDKSGDHRYSVGQRLVIRKDTVLTLAEIVSKLANELRNRT